MLIQKCEDIAVQVIGNLNHSDLEREQVHAIDISREID
jgi:hypothetical protein